MFMLPPRYSLLLLHKHTEVWASSEMHGAFVCAVQMKGPRCSSVARGNKRILSLALTHWSNLKDSCSPPGCPKRSDLISPSILSSVLDADVWKYENVRAHQRGTENRRRVSLPLLLFTASCADTPTSLDKLGLWSSGCFAVLSSPNWSGPVHNEWV